MNKSQTNFNDFTIDHYITLIKCAKQKYRFVSFDQLPQNDKFILWRHDVDYSLNRSVKIAEINCEQGIKSTFFILLHSEFYNCFEKNQTQKILILKSLGHDIGIHFDISYHNITSDSELDTHIAKESRIFSDLINIEPVAVSFHNPSTRDLSFDKESYAGLVNAYSKKIKSGTGYVSDSNGYWRHRRLFDVLDKAEEKALHVLTHPAWWQDIPMSPRKRIHRSVYKRADFVMQYYDGLLMEHNRENIGGLDECLNKLRPLYSKQLSLWDYLWNTDNFEVLFLDVWRAYESQIVNFCKETLQKKYYLPNLEAEVFLKELPISAISEYLFSYLTNTTIDKMCGLMLEEYNAWIKIKNNLIEGKESYHSELLEQGCVFMVNTLASFAEGIDLLDKSYRLSSEDSNDLSRTSVNNDVEESSLRGQDFTAEGELLNREELLDQWAKIKESIQLKIKSRNEVRGVS